MATIHHLNTDNPGVTEPREPVRFTTREKVWLFLYLAYFPVAAGLSAAFFAWLMGWW